MSGDVRREALDEITRDATANGTPTDDFPRNTRVLPREVLSVEDACEVMHDAYEQAALIEGWATQERSRVPWADVPEANKRTMRAAVTALFAALAPARFILTPETSAQIHVEAESDVDIAARQAVEILARITSLGADRIDGDAVRAFIAFLADETKRRPLTTPVDVLSQVKSVIREEVPPLPIREWNQDGTPKYTPPVTEALGATE